MSARAVGVAAAWYFRHLELGLVLPGVVGIAPQVAYRLGIGGLALGE